MKKRTYSKFNGGRSKSKTSGGSKTKQPYKKRRFNTTDNENGGPTKTDKYYELLTSFFKSEKNVITIFSKMYTSTFNAKTGLQYSGNNTFALANYRMNNPLTSKYFATFKQIGEMNGKVKPGSKAINICYFKTHTHEEVDALAKNGIDFRDKLRVQWSGVFNLVDCEGEGIKQFLEQEKHKDEKTKRFANVWNLHNFSNPWRFLYELAHSLNCKTELIEENRFEIIRELHSLVIERIPVPLHKKDELTLREKNLLAMFVLCRIFLSFHESGYGVQAVEWKTIAYANDLKQLLRKMNLQKHYSSIIGKEEHKDEIKRAIQLTRKVKEVFDEVVIHYNKLQISNRCKTIDSFIRAFQGPDEYFLNHSDVLAPIIKQIHPIISMN